MNDLQTAMHNADDIGSQMTNAVANALNSPTPVCTTHSTTLARELGAKGESYKQLIADIDSKIAALTAEREDVMLAYSMLSHGLTARETGSKQG